MANGANSMGETEKNDLSHEWLPFILLHEWLADFLLQPGAWDEGMLEEGTYLAKVAVDTVVFAGFCHLL